ncbi:Receptor-like protein 1 [Citrus sinensis]|uniref:Receptor-like protein 1 n=1 Tax=Citrus sinensis TaxID=2711 RepID=A0ACB8JCL0_CITSI|nr:Receptor-like protein 1 [Citrus sinensis]
MVSSSNLSSVKHLYLQKNAINGLTPNALSRSSKLITLDLRDNKFSGRIPCKISELSNLHVLVLRGNSLQGHIPNELCQLGKLRIMNLSHKILDRSIPLYLVYHGFYIDSVVTNYCNSILDLQPPVKPCVSIYQRVEAEFERKNRYEFFIDSNLKYMAGLDLKLQNIRALNLSSNLLSSVVPESFSNLKMTESLDLSHNILSGHTPPQLTELNLLSNFNVSYNNLSGPTPDKEQFATFDKSSYRGNHDLCGSLIRKKCSSALKPPATPTEGAEEEEDDSVIDMVALKWSFGASFLTVTLGSFAILWINSYWRRLWFYFIDRCIDTCYYWLSKYVFFRRLC